MDAVRPSDRKGFVPFIGQTRRELKRAVTGMIPFACSQNATLGRIVGVASDDLHPMPVIRFVREGRDVECYPGENLREVALREGIELYGLKGQLGNCGGCGQCITCFVSVVDEGGGEALTARTAVEDNKLRRRPSEWRLACQALVESSVMVLTRPQVRLPDADNRLKAALQAPLPAGPLAWPSPPDAEESADEEGAPATASDED